MYFKARYETLKKTWDDHYFECLGKTSLSKAPADFKDAVYYSLQAGGKRLRPVICLEMSEIYGVEFEAAIKLATALECLHTYSLIHDDLPSMDNDDLRRGMPTSHKKFGEDVAILAGDALQSLSFELVASARGGDHLTEYFAYMVGCAGLIGGQYMDIKTTDDHASDYMEEMHRKKTGYLLALSMVLPFIYQKPDISYVEIEKWGINLGVLFQIVDDILDHTSSKEKLGKSTGKDMAQNKLTYVKIYGIEKSKIMAGLLSESLKNFSQFNTSPFFQNLPLYVLNRES
ncbi:MAG: polyprenyl synthetase family protein [Spirochaetia bacterium]|nr:polyprenyl synthetase family protein [Spirochaetia bacterium]